MAYSYACADCDGMGACPGKVVAETEDEVWKLMELLAKVARLPHNSALLYLVFTRDARVAAVISRELLSVMAEKANAPVFGILDSYLGRGIVGGSLLSDPGKDPGVKIRVQRGLGFDLSPEGMI